jgi:hypothetical protein
MQRNPKSWNKQIDSSWERLKAAFKRDWDQTLHDAGGHQPDTHQHVADTVKQAAGKEAIPPRGMPTYESSSVVQAFTLVEIEDAYRFGFGARSLYDQHYPVWDVQLEVQLERDWRETYSNRRWARYREFIRRGWDYDGRSSLSKAA